MKHAQEAAGCLVAAGGQAAKLLEVAKEALDLIAVAVQVAVGGAGHEAVFFAGNDRAGPYLRDQPQDLIRVVALVASTWPAPAAVRSNSAARSQSVCRLKPSSKRSGLPSASTTA